MANNRNTGPVPNVRSVPLTEEEKKARVVQIMMQKRETFSINILCALVRNYQVVDPDVVVDKAVEMAEKLIKKLYPINEEKANDLHRD